METQNRASRFCRRCNIRRPENFTGDGPEISNGCIKTKLTKAFSVILLFGTSLVAIGVLIQRGGICLSK